MDTNSTELIMKLDYANMGDVEKFISIIKSTNIEITKIGSNEYSIIIKQ